MPPASTTNSIMLSSSPKPPGRAPITPLDAVSTVAVSDKLTPSSSGPSVSAAQ